ncbi:Predicted methyltransferase, contains TPR repeat [Pseudovibrio ascidiaceicola]|uniref:Predicted methyltransferase, contains TPR repeat n=1 Tax=Pseudovibrio ascidiaceicola TaxID=285279 RepID=A0A1I3ZHK8_9HYPH|nr:methyltransferase domain-containing protein [Pseudovibrio ascidiaceicola]SFK43557.1 Predicted methyltransferase, contains TPR repeat [Pseudovibrio ascidiaceicola]
MKNDIDDENQFDPVADILSSFFELNNALDLEAEGKYDEAAEAFELILRNDPEDSIGAALHLAAIGKGDVPSSMPEAHVKMLFDQMSESFDKRLLENLKYAVPAKVKERMDLLAAGPFNRMLDLGCGTGLCCEVLKEQVAHKTGLDLSAEILEKAREKEIYDVLHEGEITRFLKQDDHEPWDLVISTDVIPYNGVLDEMFMSVAQNMVPGGILLFTTETQPEEHFNGKPYLMGKYCRYAHSLDYVQSLLVQNNLELLDLTKMILRLEHGHPITGQLVIARKLDAA